MCAFVFHSSSSIAQYNMNSTPLDTTWRHMLYSLLLLFLAVARSELSAKDLAQDVLVRSAAKGDVNLVNEALKQDGVSVDASDKEGKTALQAAVMEGQVDMVRHLVTLGANVNLRDGFGRTALILAAVRANDLAMKADYQFSSQTTQDNIAGLQTLTTLIDAGADPLLEDKEGYNALMRSDVGTAHYYRIEARIKELVEGTPCVLATAKDCTDKEIAFAEKFKSRTAEELDAEITRLSSLLKSTAADSLKPDVRQWLRQRRNVLTQLKDAVRVPQLQAALAQAVAAEDYAKAAELKSQLKQLKPEL